MDAAIDVEQAANAGQFGFEEMPFDGGVASVTVEVRDGPLEADGVADL